METANFIHCPRCNGINIEDTDLPKWYNEPGGLNYAKSSFTLETGSPQPVTGS